MVIEELYICVCVDGRVLAFRISQYWHAWDKEVAFGEIGGAV